MKAERLVARFVRLFSTLAGRAVGYFAVMEFHKKSGQIHFHLALDGCGRVSRKAIHRLQSWCQAKMGTFDYKYMASDRAVRYCLKYLTKGASEQLPDWCWDYDGRIRSFTASGGFWHDRKKRPLSKREGKPRIQRTLRERLGRCERVGVVGIEENAVEGGAVRRRLAFVWRHAFEFVRDVASTFAQDDGRAIEKARSSFAIGLDEVGELAHRVLWADARGRAAAAGAAP